jgi:hypothetical protein
MFEKANKTAVENAIFCDGGNWRLFAAVWLSSRLAAAA